MFRKNFRTALFVCNINEKKAAKQILSNPKMQENIELCND